MKNTKEMSVAEYAKACKVSKTAVANWIQRGKVKAFQNDRKEWFISSPIRKAGKPGRPLATI